MNVSLHNITALPLGAMYREKSGAAAVTIAKENDSTIVVRADCDSLSILITERETEIYHLRERLKEIESETRETTTVTVREPRPVHWFFIYSGFLFWAIIGAGLLIKLIRWKRK